MASVRFLPGYGIVLSEKTNLVLVPEVESTSELDSWLVWLQFGIYVWLLEVNTFG
jgi:hypothetical protein